jgi:hypothetical protein
MTSQCHAAQRRVALAGRRTACAYAFDHFEKIKSMAEQGRAFTKHFSAE